MYDTNATWYITKCKICTSRCKDGYSYHGKAKLYICYKVSSQRPTRQKACEASKLPLNTCIRVKEHTKLTQSTCHRAKNKQTHKLPLNSCIRAKEHTKLTLNTCDRAKPQTKKGNSQKDQKKHHEQLAPTKTFPLTWNSPSVNTCPFPKKWCAPKTPRGWGLRTIP